MMTDSFTLSKTVEKRWPSFNFFIDFLKFSATKNEIELNIYFHQSNCVALEFALMLRDDAEIKIAFTLNYV